MSFSTLLFLASIVARAMTLVGGRAFARVARKGTFEHEHLKCVLRRLHAKGVIGAEGQGFLETMQRLVLVVTRVARFDGFCPVEKGDRPAAWCICLEAVAQFRAAPVPVSDSS